MGEKPAAPKTCVMCGADVGGRARTKDARGRYFCAACFERAREHLVARKRDTGAPGVVVAPPVNDEPDLASVVEESTGPAALRSQAVCPACDRALAFDSAICGHCGHDRVSGQDTGAAEVEVDPEPGPEPQVPSFKGMCGKCGYDLKGLSRGRCPECGTLNRARRFNDPAPKERPPLLSRAYLVPAAIALAGYAATGVLLWMVFGSTPLSLPQLVVLECIAYAAGACMYYLCALAFVGFGTPVLLVLVRLLAVYSLSAATLAAMLLMPVFCLLTLVVPMGVHFFATALLLRLDRFQAPAVGIAMFIASFMAVSIAVIVLT